jgi:uncharacterized membrane protein YphA (DoxX/SURF4 family)
MAKGTIMNKINQCKQWVQSHADVMIDLIRIYLGLGLFIKGIYFMAHRELLEQLLATSENRLFAQAAIAHYVIPVHLLGGLMLALGILTRVAALAQIPIMLGAVLYVHLPKVVLVEPRQSFEFSMLVLFLLIIFFVFGGGRWSVDYYLSRKSDVKSQTAPIS